MVLLTWKEYVKSLTKLLNMLLDDDPSKVNGLCIPEVVKHKLHSRKKT